ncbi:ABC transporter ATP-binding protein [Lachnospiraceae bacterium MD1]|jgi:putative ABC transport system ATP-binding protein|uniref:ABC transporter ATP-binding protein n=1 Tax=Variimorphobacter saccharofermentans TaxID=2755051 RepID=A0A839K3T8_9FIRM|nr:ABC transporter ATP-binding protein [Variimorphobacter saccharofermentans]MBB2184027.1 ABC transporter ATP-binding protein [Variimorphobacter saccharofermentans]
MEIIKCINVKKTYIMGKEKVEALRGINLEIKKGEFVALLGKSGSGKSTLLNMLAGLERPSEGEIYLNQEPIHSLNETKITNIRKKHVGFIFQSYNLLPTRSAIENVCLPLTFNRFNERERLRRGKEMLISVGLGDRLYHKPNQMSGGQQQRVSIARAFINNPEIVFADEPTGNLDTKTTEEVMQIMLGMIQKHNQTFVMVTHDEELSYYADRIFYMKDGLVEKVVDNKKSS